MVAGIPDIDSMLDNKIDQLIKQDFSSTTEGSEPSVGQIVVSFSQKIASKSKKRSGWFGQAKSEPLVHTMCWESWTINVKCLPLLYSEHQYFSGSINGASGINSAEQLLRLSALSFETTLNEIMTITNTHKDHIPPIMTLDVCPFPYEIIIDPQTATKLPPAADDETWAQYIKKLMEQI